VTSVAAWSGGDGSSALVLTASKDCSARAWAVSGGGGEEPLSVAPAALLEGHSDSLSAVCVSPDGARCATGGVDSQLCLWRLDGAAAAAGAAGAPKRRKKKGGDGEEAAAAAASIASDAALSGHSGCVSGLVWPEAGALWSCGWDHTLRRWDVERGACAATLNDGASKAVLALDVRGGGAQLVAFAGAEKSVRVWDARAGGAAAQTALAGHGAGWVSAVRWCPWHDQQLLSAGQDGALKLWDLRGAAAVHSTALGGGEGEGEAARLQAADFWPGRGVAERCVAAGGEEGKVHVMRAWRSGTVA